jgi:hypothetical protein
MAVKNLQTVALCVAECGVRVTGMESKVEMRLPREFTAPLSLPRLPRPGYPIRTGPDADLRGDNAPAAQAVTRVGRSVRGSARLATHLTKRWSPKNLSRG